jgi:hypothetical protein
MKIPHEVIDSNEVQKLNLINTFDLVKNKEHWKNPINSYCTTDEVKLVAEAIHFFTATEAHFDYIGIVLQKQADATRFKIGDHIMKVRADGYRKGPAGDH